VSDIVAIHQPNYLPWLGYFNKMQLADKFILYDTAQYPKNNFANRNKIRTKDGWVYLTIPIEKGYHFKPIAGVELPKDDRWKQKHWASIQANYARAGYFDSYKNELEQIYTKEKFETLVDVNLRLIEFVRIAFGIETEMLRSSELDWDPQKKGTNALIDMLEAVGAKRYLTGSGGSDEYLDREKFTTIKLQWHEYQHPTYHQAFPGFQSHMAAVDAVLNLGDKAKELI